MSKTNNMKNIRNICSFYKNNKQIFNESIELFSSFMTITNENYNYNKTYLESYINELDVFSEKFIGRDELIAKIFHKIGIKLIKIPDVKIIIDNMWILDSNGIDYKEFKGKFVLKDNINIEFKKESKVIDIRRFFSGDSQLDDIINFLEEHLKGKVV